MKLTSKAREALLRLAGDGERDMTRQMSDRLARAGLIDYDLDRHEWVVTAKGLEALGGPTPRITMEVKA